MASAAYDRRDDRGVGGELSLADADRGGVLVFLRLEGALAFAGLCFAFHSTGGSWWLFAGLFLVPDLSILGYLIDNRVGAALYNAAHTYLAPGALVLIAEALGLPGLIGPAIIWAAHIGFDRMLGLGLKYTSFFGATHLGWRGKHP